jgi:PAS domain S-box-containing protein
MPGAEIVTPPCTWHSPGPHPGPANSEADDYRIHAAPLAANQPDGGVWQMNLFSRFGNGGETGFQVLWEDGDRVLCRGQLDCGGDAVLVVLPATDLPTAASLDRLTHEYGLKDELDRAWAVLPLSLLRERGRTALVLDDPGGETLDRILVAPMAVGRFLRLAIGITTALGKVHQHGLVHKEVKPSNILLSEVNGDVRLTGFGIASRLPRERQAPEPPELIAGTLAYMAPEQTGRMNRSIDSRSDLYSLGITFYQMLTGSLPFTASDPMEWIHCHIARRPTPPSESLKSIPSPVSAIIMKLLAKTAEERYQTAAGVESDLQRCLAEWRSRGRIDEFPVGEHDTPDRWLIPEKLYGRAREIDTLLASFDRVVASGTPELALVSGYSGIGKSSVVNELYKVLVPSRGLFASGKFDQYKRDIPYATLAQAFQSLVRPLLGKNEAELNVWRDALRQALGPNGLLIEDLVPELKLIIGEQPPVPDLPPQDAQNRFQLVFRRFISVFAQPEHPLALFLDDLQWLDAATLDLLEDLLTQPDVRHLMLIGAYRDNEVSPSHPLMRKLVALRQAGSMVQEIILAPLVLEDLRQLIADSVRCEPEAADPLAQLVHEKTGGNPFFAIQFVSALSEEGLLTFDHSDARWSWDLNRIHAKGYTDNVVDLMVGKLNRLPVKTQKALQQLACLGNSAEFAVLSTVYQDSMEEMHDDIWEAVRTGFVFRSEGAYKFLHDRVQEAAYSLIPEGERAATHLRIGRRLASRTSPAETEEAIFEIVNQLNRGAHLIVSTEEREQVAELNFIAGRRAKMSVAYASALTYLAASRALLTEESWNSSYELVFAVELSTAECELLTADMTAAEARLSILAQRARTVQHIAAVARLRLTLYTTLDESDRGVQVCLEYLRRGGTFWSPHPSENEVYREYERIWSQLGDRTPEEIIDLPLMSDPESLATIDVLTEVVTPALFTDEHLLALVICRMVNISLEYGNTDGSCFAYVWLGMIAGPRFADYQMGFRFGRLGYDLIEKHQLHRFQARTYMSFGNLVMPWTKHIRTGRDLVRRAFDAANKIGDLTFAAYSCNNLNTNLIAAGDLLGDVQREVENGLDFAQKARFGLVVDIITTQLRLVRTLRGLTPIFGSFFDDQFDEVRFEHHLASDPRLALPECWYWIRKLQARFFAADYSSAIEASLKAQRLLWTSPSFVEVAEYEFYSALSRAAHCEFGQADHQRQHFEALTPHRKQLDAWAENCPENFETRAALVSAEIARIEGRELDAMRLYERAIRSARENGFIQNEALANELAGRFLLDRDLETAGYAHLRNARASYALWGADGKVAQLDQRHPRLTASEPHRSSTSSSTVQQLDVTAVVRASQAVSSEIVLPKLVETLMTLALQDAGANRGLLLLPQGDEFQIEAEALMSGNKVAVALRQAPISDPAYPETVLRYVIRTHKSVILDDGTKAPLFSDDEYLRRRKPGSVLCLPLMRQGQLAGLLYLENTLATHAFTADRVAVLEVLASQAAISLENTRLYGDLQEREAKVRCLVDSNIIGIFIWDFQGQITDANETFLRLIGFDRDDLLSGHVRWTALTPAEWRDKDERYLMELKDTGTVLPYEKEFFRRDGSRVPVLVGAAGSGERQDEGIAFVVDLTERRRSEEELRESERRYREVQMELAHANRTATMGQLSASIAHEVNQPIAAVVTNAQAALRWLGARPPNLEEVRQTLGRIVADGIRASEVISRIHALVRKAPQRKDALDINEAILEVIGLTHGEVVKNSVTVHMELEERLPLIQGDRVQLQQVMLNLIINAVEAMTGIDPEFKELQVSTSRTEPDVVLVAVRDSGSGFDLTNLEHVFEAFYTTKPSGLGMGLSICRSIIEAHGGRLWASANTLRGAVFQFTLPVEGYDS